jgi:hypothetical protein
MNGSIDVADEVWIATALLHKEHPERRDFANQEILARLEQEGLVKPVRPGVTTHISIHAVAGKKPQPNDYRLLTETSRGHRRLFRNGDLSHPERKGKTTPSKSDLPSRYLELLKWYAAWNLSDSNRASPSLDPLTALAGTWTFGDADTYVREMREGWE